jgi:hypothetical protein
MCNETVGQGKKKMNFVCGKREEVETGRRKPGQ